jgi:response regulator RpfG family c-di-GMP phosphodiesterase
MTGVQLTAEIRRRQNLRHIPVIVVTATHDRGLRYEALEAGAVDFLAKPIDPIEVRTRCRNLLLLAHQYSSIKNYALLQQKKLDQLQGLLRSLTGEQPENTVRQMQESDLVTVGYDKLFAITSCVAGVQELIAAAQRNIADIEAQLTKPLRGAPGK